MRLLKRVHLVIFAVLQVQLMLAMEISVRLGFCLQVTSGCRHVISCVTVKVNVNERSRLRLMYVYSPHWHHFLVTVAKGL
jgi:hypothetical protein